MLSRGRVIRLCAQPPAVSSTGKTKKDWESYGGEGGREGGGRGDDIIQSQESLVLYKSFNNPGTGKNETICVDA
jgi:hypothetical protein